MPRMAVITPEIGQKFNAYVRGFGHIAIGCPCIAKEIKKDFICAVDSMGAERIFYHSDFWFEVVKKT